MWADGTHQYRLTYTAADEDYPSVSADGTLIAFQRGAEVWIMNVDGTMQSKIADGEKPVISPRGDWIAYKGVGNDTIHLSKTDGSRHRSFPGGTAAAIGATERLGWTREGNFLLFENGTSIDAYEVRSGDINTVLNESETLKAPWGQFSNGEVFFTVGATFDPYVGIYTGPIPPDTPSAGSPWGGGSAGVWEAYPTLSPRGDKLLVVEYPSGTTAHEIYIYDKNPPRSNKQQLTNTGFNTRPAWIRQR